MASSSASSSLHPKKEKAQTFSGLEKFDWAYLCNLKNTDEIRQNIQCRKGIGDIDTLLRVWKQFGQEDDPDEKQRLMLQLEQLASDIPNKKHPQAPVGDESCAQLVKMIGQPQADEKIKQPIVQLAEKAGWLRMSNLGISTGQRSYFLQNQFAHLEQALVRFTLDRLRDQGFQLVSVPEILKPEIIEGCGFTTTGERTQVYKIGTDSHDPLCLSGTSEMALGGYFSDQLLTFDQLPIKVAAVSRCHRAEISGVDEEKGIYRVHNFTKVEMFAVTGQDSGSESDEMLQHFVDIQTNLYTELGLHFQILDMPSQELGAPASRKFDSEAWMPAKKFWGEISSASNCTDFQSRRLNIKYKMDNGSVKYVHTVNGTACAVPRILMALVENNQRDNGKVDLPTALHSYFGAEALTPVTKPQMKWTKFIKSFVVS